MTCPEVMELMNRYMDHDLSESEINHLNEHLRECSSCQVMFERLKRLSAELESLPKVMPKFSIVDTILPQLENIDLAAAKEQSPEDGQLEGGAASITAAPVKRSWRERFPLRAIGGVVAAGFVVGLFMVLYKPEVSQQADMELMSTANQAGVAASQDTFAADMPGDEAKDMSKVTTESAQPDKKADSKPEANGPKEKEAPASNKGDEPAAGALPQEVHKSGDANEGTGSQDNIAQGFARDNAGIASQGEAASPEAGVEDPAMDMRMGIAKTTRLESPSPDLRFTAFFESGLLKVTDTDNKVVYEKELPNGSVHRIEWSEDGKTLTYEWSQDGGETVTETVAASEFAKK
ncbi:hypothetical protein PAE9249_03557 [Paenibacillus sp. CECT 9249]|nr:hypothetical protein PAE9249_03557 [Paenibacillus sp. CECT 9249]